MRPCIECGRVTEQSRCPDHQRPTIRSKDTRRRKSKGQAAYDPVWRKLSTQARRASPFCIDCGAVDDLTADHIIPKSVAPELVHAIENVAVRCRTCNTRKGSEIATADAREVLARLMAYHRHPSVVGRRRIAAAEAALARGNTPGPGGHPDRGEAKSQILTEDGVPPACPIGRAE